MTFPSGQARGDQLVVHLNGKPYIAAQAKGLDGTGVRQWQEALTSIQEEIEPAFSIPMLAHEGSGFSWGDLPGTIQDADGFDCSAPGRISTWPRLTTGAPQSSGDATERFFNQGGYHYRVRGRIVRKYLPASTPASAWPIIEAHDLGANALCKGRPFDHLGLNYVPRTVSGTDGVFHQLTTVVTTVTETQTVAISGTPTGGTYNLVFDGKTTANLAHNASGAAVQAALRALPGLEQITVSTAGSDPNFTHTVTMTGAGGALGTASPPQMTSVNNLTGGAPVITHATTVAGTTDTWTAGPATREARGLSTFKNTLVLFTSNTIRRCSGDPMNAGNWGAAYTVGDSGHAITDALPLDDLLMVGKTDGLWTFDEEAESQVVLPQIGDILDDSNCDPMGYWDRYLLVPHRSGLIAWSETDWRYVGVEQEGALDAATGYGWGRVQGIASAGKITYLAINDVYHGVGALVGLLPGRGGREPIPHVFQRTADGAGAALEALGVVTVESQAEAPHSPATVVDDATVGTITWSNVGNASASDDSRASAAEGTSHYIKATNFGFSVPSEATIRGVLLEVERRAVT